MKRCSVSQLGRVGTLSVLLGLLAAQAQSTGPASTTTAAATQAVREMQGRLAASLKAGKLDACRREGDNLARYGQADAGLVLIDADLAAVQARLQDISDVYAALAALRDAQARGALSEAYLLIRAVAVKMTEDAMQDLLVTLVSGAAPKVGQVLIELGKQGGDFLGNFKDAYTITNRARALQQLDRLVTSGDAQLSTLQAAIREAQAQRTLLTACRADYQAAVSAVAKGAPLKNSGRWVLVSVTDNRYEADWVQANRHLAYNYFPSYARGSYSVRTEYERDGDKFSTPPTLAGENWLVSAQWTLPPALIAGNQTVPLKAKLNAVETYTSFFKPSGYTAAWVGGTRMPREDGKTSGIELNTQGTVSATFLARLGTGSEGQRKTIELSFISTQRLGTVYTYEWSATKQPISPIDPAVRPLSVPRAVSATPAPTPAPSSPAPASPAQPASGWSGAWKTSDGSIGVMTLTVKGDVLTGSYPHRDGRVTGTLRGNEFTGEWVQSNGRGGFRLTLSPDGKTLKGAWNYASDGQGNWRSFTASRP